MSSTPGPKVHLRTSTPDDSRRVVGPAEGPRRSRSDLPSPILTTEYRQPRLGGLRLRRRTDKRARTKPRRSFRPRLRWIWVAITLPLLVLLGGLLYGWYQWEQIPRTEGLGPLPPPGDVETILMVGSDTRADLAGEEFGGSSVGGQRADSLLLLVLPPGRQKATMLSIPRDLRVDVPGRGVGKINGAFNGGAQMMIGAVQAATGLTVNHYVEVNFDGFRDLSSAVGGVEMCVDTAVRDKFSDLDLPAGCHLLQGDTALAWVRSRHLERFENGTWRSDPTGDYGRMQRQQEFLQKLMGKMGSPTSAVRLPQISSAAKAAFTIDEGFSYWHALRVASRFVPSPSSKLQFTTLPTNPKRIGGLAYAVAAEPEASQLLEQLRTGQVPVVEQAE